MSSSIFIVFECPNLSKGCGGSLIPPKSPVGLSCPFTPKLTPRPYLRRELPVGSGVFPVRPLAPLIAGESEELVGRGLAFVMKAKLNAPDAAVGSSTPSA